MNSQEANTVMMVQVNGKAREVAEGVSVADLLDDLEIDRRYVAVERNRQLVPREQHQSEQLAEGDQLEVVTLVGGG